MSGGLLGHNRTPSDEENQIVPENDENVESQTSESMETETDNPERPPRPPQGWDTYNSEEPWPPQQQRPSSAEDSPAMGFQSGPFDAPGDWVPEVRKLRDPNAPPPKVTYGAKYIANLFFPPQKESDPESRAGIKVLGKDKYPKTDPEGKGDARQIDPISTQQQLNKMESAVFKAGGEAATAGANSTRLQEELDKVKRQLYKVTVERDETRREKYELERQNTKLRKAAERFPDVELSDDESSDDRPQTPRPTARARSDSPTTPKAQPARLTTEISRDVREGVGKNAENLKALQADILFLRGVGALKKGKFVDAIRHAIDSIELAEQIKRHDLLAQANLIIGRAEYALEKWDAAADAFEESLQNLKDAGLEDERTEEWVQLARDKAVRLD